MTAVAPNSQGNGRPVFVGVDADHFCPAMGAVDNAAEADRPQTGNQQRVVRAHAGPLHRAEGWTQTAAGH